MPIGEILRSMLMCFSPDVYLNFCIEKSIPSVSESIQREYRAEVRSIIIDCLWKSGVDLRSRYVDTYIDSSIIEIYLSPWWKKLKCIITANVRFYDLSYENIEKITRLINDIKIRLEERGYKILEHSIDSYPKDCRKYKWIFR